MSGPVLCALPSVPPQSVFQLPCMQRTVQPALPYTETFSRHSSTCISLPPLPRYPDTVLNRKRWGEDNVMFNNTLQTACSGRNNFDCCHSVPDVQASKYEGYMFPKPMHQDLTVLHCSPSNTNRHVHRDLGPELFPTHDPLRKTTDHSYMLVEATRKALSDYITQLYRTSRYDLNFRDTTEFMKRKADRDQQYKELCGGSTGPSTWFTVLNRPDPFPYSWTGDINNVSREEETGEQTDDHSEPKKQHDVIAEPSRDQNMEMETAHDDLTETTVDPSGDGKNSLITSDETCWMKFKSNVNDNVKLVTGYPADHGDGIVDDTFGPWSGSRTLSDDCESLLKSHVYNFKLPTPHHNAQTENEFASSQTERHGCKQRYQDYIGAWTALRRPKMANNDVNQPERKCTGYTLIDILEKQRDRQENLFKSKQNNWTFRDDKNNLRIPCISKVIGYKNKTDAHNKIHMDHPEPMPDLRDFKRYSKRVNFYGYNSSVFR